MVIFYYEWSTIQNYINGQKFGTGVQIVVDVTTRLGYELQATHWIFQG